MTATVCIVNFMVARIMTVHIRNCLRLAGVGKCLLLGMIVLVVKKRIDWIRGKLVEEQFLKESRKRKY